MPSSTTRNASFCGVFAARRSRTAKRPSSASSFSRTWSRSLAAMRCTLSAAARSSPTSGVPSTACWRCTDATASLTDMSRRRKSATRTVYASLLSLERRVVVTSILINFM